jgi:hypothetical protein
VNPRHRLTPAAVTAVLRAAPAPRLRLTAARTFICEPCLVSWSGDEADCWNCGLPATTSRTRRRAHRALLATTGRPARRHIRKGVLR